MKANKNNILFLKNSRFIITKRIVHSSALLLTLFALLTLSNCSPTLRLSENEYLLWKNKIEFIQSDKAVSSSDVYEYIRPEPNQKLLGLTRLKLQLHNIGNNGKNNKLRNWLIRIGEPPVYLDSFKTNRSTEQIKLYLQKHGYFNAETSDTTYFKKRNPKKGVNVFRVNTHVPYKVRQVNYEIGDVNIKSNIENDLEASLIKVGDNYNYDLLDEERTRLTAILQNESFYAFNKDFWYAEIDSSLGTYEVDINIKLKQLSAVDQSHAVFKKHKLGNIEVHCGYDPYKKDNVITNTINYKGYTFHYFNNSEFKPEVLFLSLFLSKGDYYKRRNLELTYKRLSALKYFGAINIQFEQTETNSSYPLLETKILLTPRTKQNFTIETRGTNTGGNLGVAGSFVYGNKNTFKGGEELQLTLAGGLESQQIITDQELEDKTGNKLFRNLSLNTLEFGPELRLIIPKFLLPFKAPRFSKSSNPKTIFAASLNFQQRPDYIRSNTNFSLSYEWKESLTKKHIITPAEISVIKINKSADFTNRLKTLNDQLLLNSYNDHLIAAFRYTFIFNSQLNTTSRKNTYFKANFESAGNLLNLTDKIGLTEKVDTFNTLFNIRYAQYLKTDFDLRKYAQLSDKNVVAFRVVSGIGVPLKNLNVLPFERSFFGGGANDIRAWQARTIGPGSYTDTSSVISFDKIGDIKLGASIEYRFDVIKYIEGAIFVDAGNVWLLSDDTRRIGGQFKPNTFVSEIAFGTGIGARFDFDFFIIRLDAGFKLKDPALVQSERWFYQPKTEYEKLHKNKYPKSVIWNLGIGYPF